MINTPKYPYTDFHELNLDWVIDKINSLDHNIETFKASNTIRWCGVWTLQKSYTAWSIVTDNNKAYISINDVPVSTLITNTKYWVLLTDLSMILDDINNHLGILDNSVDNIEQNVTAINADISNIHSYIDDIESDVIEINSKIDNMFEKTEVEFANIVYDAGTIGTRGAQYNVNISSKLSQGYEIQSLYVSYIKDSSAMIPVVFQSGVNIYLNLYRARSTAETGSNSVKITYILRK